MAENGDITNFTPTAKPKGTWTNFVFLLLLCIYKLERAQEHQPATSNSTGKLLFLSSVRYLGISPRRQRRQPKR